MGQRRRAVGHVATTVLTLAVAALLAVVAHQATWTERRWPVGVAVAVGLTAAVALLLRAWGVGPVARAAGLLTWLVVTFAAALRRPEGDVLVPANARGYAFLVVGFAVLAAGLTAPGGRGRRARG
ncbi:hypothetical protein [Angustibacter sp. Root456]|uniref:hypothetical protein n=1 Tax=Angustibacter sp. Root456 TaxID=1736539 RepID=UPI0006FF5BE8|nr:hypothetical protein [Angustibacter sp. Root456]KQX65610.1 hypothetical protein ASD06_08195 [Angustibacter sp. Root456]